MGRAHVTPRLMAWARRRRGLSVEEVAKKLSVKSEAILDWEVGERQPTFRQAQKYAHVLHIPFGYLYLSDPPIEELPLPDFRTMPGEAPREPSPDLLDLLSDVLGKQQWFREYRRLEGIEELPFVGRFKPTDPDRGGSQRYTPRDRCRRRERTCFQLGILPERANAERRTVRHHGHA